MSSEGYQNKLSTIYLDMNQLGTHYNSDEQDFIDSFFNEEELKIIGYENWQKKKIDEIWDKHIRMGEK